MSFGEMASVGDGGGVRRGNGRQVGRVHRERERDHVAHGPRVVRGVDLDRLQAVGRETGQARVGRDREVPRGVGRPVPDCFGQLGLLGSKPPMIFP